MAVKNTEPSVKFTTEQARQLETWKSRVTASQEELTANEKQNKQLKDENEKLDKEKKHKTDQIAHLTREVCELQDKSGDLVVLVTANSELLQKQGQTIAAATEAIDKKRHELDTREQAALEAEETNSKRAEELAVRSNELDAEKRVIERAQAAFTKAAETLVWK